MRVPFRVFICSLVLAAVPCCKNIQPTPAEMDQIVAARPADLANLIDKLRAISTHYEERWEPGAKPKQGPDTATLTSTNEYPFLTSFTERPMPLQEIAPNRFICVYDGVKPEANIFHELLVWSFEAGGEGYDNTKCKVYVFAFDDKYRVLAVHDDKSIGREFMYRVFKKR